MTPRPIPLRPDPDALRVRAVRSLARAAIAAASYKLDSTRPRQWRDDADVQFVLRTATSPTSLTSAASLAPITTQFLASLMPLSAGAQLLDMGVGLTFDGMGSISLPTISTIYADWVAENSAIPARAGTTAAGASLTPCKLAVLCSLSGEMVRHSEAETIVSQVLAESTAPAIDASLFSTTAGTPGLRPPGLMSGIAPMTPTALTGSMMVFEAMATDLAALGSAVSPYAGNNQIAFVAAPPQAIAVNLRLQPKYPVMASNALPAKSILCVAVPALVSVTEQAPMIDASGETLVQEADPADAIVLPSGAVASNTRSLYQTDSVSLRLRLPLVWALRVCPARWLGCRP
jgi:Phage capsid family